jgi:hypothetical protein
MREAVVIGKYNGSLVTTNCIGEKCMEFFTYKDTEGNTNGCCIRGGTISAYIKVKENKDEG